MTADELINAAHCKRAVRHPVWGTRPAAFVIQMQFAIVARELKYLTIAARKPRKVKGLLPLFAESAPIMPDDEVNFGPDPDYSQIGTVVCVHQGYAYIISTGTRFGLAWIPLTQVYSFVMIEGEAIVKPH